jgi:hypothetical protein
MDPFGEPAGLIGPPSNSSSVARAGKRVLLREIEPDRKVSQSFSTPDVLHLYDDQITPVGRRGIARARVSNAKRTNRCIKCQIRPASGRAPMLRGGYDGVVMAM